MKAEFNRAFDALKNCLAAQVPEMGNVITHWEDPVLVQKNRAIMLPEAATGSGDEELSFTVKLCASIVEKNADAVARAQMEIMQKIFEAVYGNAPAPIISASINNAEFFNPAVESPNTGILLVFITAVVDAFDDCGM